MFANSILSALKRESNRTVTENGAATLISTQSSCLDFFATIGALRGAPESEIIARFQRAYAENPDHAMKILFYGRDVRGGLGERRIFRVVLSYLAQKHPASVIRNLESVAEMGRWDDLLTLMGTPVQSSVVALVQRQLNEDTAQMEKGQSCSLLAKWLPSVNTSNPETVRLGKQMAQCLGMRESAYRRLLSRLRAHLRILENNLRVSDYTFPYEAQPSGAMFKYRKAFLRNDGERYQAYMDKVSSGQAHLHTSSLTPVDLVSKALRFRGTQQERMVLNTTWNALEDFTDNRNALCVVDTSGSMFSGQPAAFAVAMSLGIYFAEHTHGAFRNHFITFSNSPRLIEIKGGDFVEKVEYCTHFSEVADTNIQAVFELILNAAVTNHVPQHELPETIYIISDMEFNFCTRNASLTNFEYAKSLFTQHGYRLPQIVFWNVQSRNTQQPVHMNEQGVALVSGYTPRLFNMVASGQLSPYRMMMQIIGSERYAAICA